MAIVGAINSAHPSSGGDSSGVIVGVDIKSVLNRLHLLGFVFRRSCFITVFTRVRAQEKFLFVRYYLSLFLISDDIFLTVSKMNGVVDAW